MLHPQLHPLQHPHLQNHSDHKFQSENNKLFTLTLYFNAIVCALLTNCPPNLNMATSYRPGSQIFAVTLLLYIVVFCGLFTLIGDYFIAFKFLLRKLIIISKILVLD